MKRTSLAICLLLAACGGGAEDAGNNTSAEDAPAAVAVEGTPENLTDDPGNSVVPIAPAPAPAASVGPVAAIPAAFLGRWGMTVADCDPSTGADKGSMTIAADRLNFYESRAVPGNIRLATPDQLTTDLTFSGEGQTWTQTATLTLQDDGKTLVREVTKGDDLGVKGAQKYSRCPA